MKTDQTNIKSTKNNYDRVLLVMIILKCIGNFLLTPIQREAVDRMSGKRLSYMIFQEILSHVFLMQHMDKLLGN